MYDAFEIETSNPAVLEVSENPVVDGKALTFNVYPVSEGTAQVTISAFVGDSLGKDMRLAREVGALGCWAEYGTYVSAEYQERLAILSAPAATRRHLRQAPDAEAMPRVRLSCFDQLIDVIDAENARSRVSVA